LLLVIVAAVFLIGSIVGIVVAVRQGSSASGWRQDDQKALAQLAKAQLSVESLNTQLSAQANAKEKALDQDTLLTKVVNSENTVSNELNTCVNDMNQFLTTLGTDLEDGNANDPTLTQQSNAAQAECTKAQNDNNALQSTLNGASG
jgi:uncharacterized membrane protein